MKYNESITIRNDIKPGDLGYITYFHGIIYNKEYGFDITFERYIAVPLSDFIFIRDPKSRIWILERKGKILGSIAIVNIDNIQAQLRWFLIDPSLRGKGHGKKLLEESLTFCREMNFKKIILWTINFLDAAIHLYIEYGFVFVEEKKHVIWGKEIIEQKYELML